MRTLLVFLLLALQPQLMFAQSPKSFSDNSEQWYKDVKDFLSAANKDEARSLMQKFEPVWIQGKLTSSQQKKIIDMSNIMLKKRLNARFIN